jgi:signal transduction histidine kinase
VWRPRVLGTLVIWCSAVISLGVGTLSLATFGSPILVAAAIAVASTTGAVLTVYRPLLGWRLSMLALLVSPFLAVPPPNARLLGLVWAQPIGMLHLVVVLLLALAVPGRVIALAVALDVVVVGIASLAVGPGATSPVVLAALLFVGLVAGLGTALRAQRVATAGLDDARRDQAEERVRRSVVEERAQIARDLHDVVAHHLSAIVLRAESAPDRGADLEAELRTIAEAGRAALADVRRLLQVLRDGDAARPHEPAPGLDRLPELITAARDSGVGITFQERGRPRPLPDAVGLVGFRVAQEALSNAGRHAAGAPVTVLLDWLPSAVRLQVENGPGPGGPPGDAGHGLTGMRERAATVGGLLAAGPRPDGGFVVDLTVPA